MSAFSRNGMLWGLMAVLVPLVIGQGALADTSNEQIPMTLASVYSFLEVSGTVTNETTGQPVAHVVISQERLLGGPTIIGYSDLDGNFDIDYFSEFRSEAYPRDEEPEPRDTIVAPLTFEKTGYHPKKLDVEYEPGTYRRELGDVTLERCSECLPHIVEREDRIIAVGRQPPYMLSPPAHFAVFAPDGEHVLIGSGRTVQLWDIREGKHVRAFTGHRDRPHAAVFLDEGRRLVTGGTDDTVRLWDVETGRLRRTHLLFHNVDTEAWRSPRMAPGRHPRHGQTRFTYGIPRRASM